jgi:integration host factor subunit alpha
MVVSIKKKEREKPCLQQSTVTREHLARAVKRKTGVGAVRSSQIVDKIIRILAQSMCSKKDIKIRLFGTFAVKRKNARVGRNPKTLAEAAIAARNVVKFSVAPTLKKKVNYNIKLCS